MYTWLKWKKVVKRPMTAIPTALFQMTAIVGSREDLMTNVKTDQSPKLISTNKKSRRLRSAKPPWARMTIRTIVTPSTMRGLNK
jgi:hypothetical protein